MRPNLSLTNIASTLAALGTSAVIVACGGDSKSSDTPANATPSATAAPSASAAASCNASAHPTDNAAAATTGNTATPTTTTATTATPATTTAAATTTSTAKPAGTAAAKPPAGGGSGSSPTKPKATGQASCGAGTCSSDPKKK